MFSGQSGCGEQMVNIYYNTDVNYLIVNIHDCCDTPTLRTLDHVYDGPVTK